MTRGVGTATAGSGIASGSMAASKTLPGVNMTALLFWILMLGLPHHSRTTAQSRADLVVSLSNSRERTLERTIASAA